MSHWSEYAYTDPSKQYTRNLVYSVPGVFNLLLLVWNPGNESPVHDHADAHCLMKILKGSLVESRFAIPERPGEQGPLEQTSRKEFKLNQVSYMTDRLGLHSVSNPHITEHAVSLHLYTPPNAALRGCHVYDMTNGVARHVTQNVYDSVKGKVVK
ncbi:Cysteine dioxygenase [Lachnellula suecica]|uniref:Cysteine dioxygenase n=1 Tax=Lachnellula suecica TaxID=602035 RepID=A0A8T9C587_9HELO|nr:Cysteine dioxygenase [Lachnellula suecica]